MAEESETPKSSQSSKKDEAPGPSAVEKPPQKVSFEKTAKIQVDPNASVIDCEESHYLTALPVVPEQESTVFKPILYTFRVKTRGKNRRLKKMKSKPPPFCVLFDHTIAVIWTLFNSDSSKEGLGVVQLQWALHFLKSIYSNEGIHSKDIQLCIEVIEKFLIDKYAAISLESAMYGVPKFEAEQEQSIGFSKNYEEMIKKCPGSGAVSETEETIGLDKQLLEDLENVKNVVGIESIDLTKVVSKEQVMNILNDWKKEQIGKIQDDLKQLVIVEDMMKNSDSQNFEGYTDESYFQSCFKRTN